MGQESGGVPMRELNLRQEAFCEGFVRHGGNASLAFEEAGYALKGKGVHNVSKMLAHPKIRQRIQEIRGEITKQHVDLRERLIAELEAIAFANVCDHLDYTNQTLTVHDLGELTRSQASAVESVTQIETDSGPALRVKFHDKLVAIDKLSKILGLYRDQDPAAFRAFVIRTPHVATSTGEWLTDHAERQRLPEPPKQIEGPTANVARLPEPPSSP